MRFFIYLLLFYPLTLAFARNLQRNPQSPESSDQNKIISILKSLSIGKIFCSSLICPHGPLTTTRTTSLVKTEEQCTTKTENQIVRDQTKTITTGTVLPTLTITSYSSSVLVPSRPSPIVNKRTPVTAPAELAANPSAAALSAFSPGILSQACSSLFPCSTVTTTVTAISKIKCTTTLTSYQTKYKATVTTTATTTPAPATVSKPGTLTTTVPAACAGSPYVPSSNMPDGTEVQFASYPNFPRSTVECCVVCARTLNCAASAYIDEAADCELLITTKKQKSGFNNQCPLGVVDYEFGTPQPDGIVFPGYCGK